MHSASSRVIALRQAATVLAVLAVAAALLSLAPARTARADQPAAAAATRSAADLMPATTVVYAELARPAELVDLVLAHPLRQRVETLDAYRAAVLSKEYLKFQFGLSVAETALGMKWRDAVATLAGRGVYVGIDAATQGGVVLVRATDGKKLAEVRDRLLAFARAEAKKKGNPDALQEVEYRGVKAYKAGDGYAATLGPWLMLTNKAETGKAVIDRAADSASPSLGGKMEFLSAQNAVGREPAGGKPAAWAYVDVATLRSAGLLAKILRDKTENVAVEMLVGGLLSNLLETPYAVAALHVDEKQLRLVASAPHDPAWVAKPREFYFGPGGKGAAPVALRPDQTALSLVAHRDLAGMWLAAPELLDEKGNAELTQADSNLSNLFAGKEFGSEILGAFEPDWQLVLARQDYAATGGGVPDIKLPAGALLFRMKDPDKMQRQLKIAFQSIVGFLNIAGGQNGLPQFDLNTERRGDDLIVSAEYMLDDQAQRSDGKIYHNFSPTVAVVGERFIIASTKTFAATLVDALRHPPTTPPTAADAAAAAPPTNTALEIDVAVVHRLLADNRSQLVAQNMLEKGHAKDKAEAEIGTLLDALSWFDRASLRLTTPSDRLELELAVRFAEKTAAP